MNTTHRIPRILSTLRVLAFSLAALVIVNVNDIVAGMALTGNGTASTLAEWAGEADGYKFMTGNDSLIVNWLGLYDAPNGGGSMGDGLLADHWVRLWRESDQSLVASTLILSGTNESLIGSFRGHAITNVVLEMNAAYRIAADYGGEGDRLLDGDDLTGWTTNSIFITRGCYGGAGGYPGSDWGILLSANFGFDILANRPWADITSLTGSVTIPDTTSSIAIAGTNNEYAVGTIWWTNSLGGGGGVPADGRTGTGWTFNVALSLGTNVITVCASNDAGYVTSDMATVDVVSASAKQILSFGPGAIINGTDIAWTVPYGTDRSMLTPTYTVSEFATGNPPSGTTMDFTIPQTYTVTAQDLSSLDYTVTVNVRSDGSDAQLTFTNGMIVWLKADAIDTNDPAQVRTSGSDLYVQLWNDQSGNDHSASNSIEADQPQFIDGVLNGRPALRFSQVADDNGSKLFLGDLSARFPGGATLFAVATIDNDGRYNLFGNRDNDDRWVADSWVESMPGSFRGGRSEVFSYGSWPQSGSHVYVMDNGIGASFRVAIDGTSIGSDTADYNTGSGLNWTIGDSAAGNGQQLRGDIPELILYDHVLSSNEADQVGAYLASKYGLNTAYPLNSSTPFVDITNSFGTTNVPYGTTVFNVVGTNNAFTIGTIWWTNNTSGPVGATGGVFLADSVTGWSFNAALSPGSNMIVVSGSNAAGAVHSTWTRVDVVLPEPAVAAIIVISYSLLVRAKRRATKLGD